MKPVNTLVRSMAAAGGALIMSSVLSVAPAHAAATVDICKSADAMADGVYELALKSPRLYPTAADAAAAAKAAFTRRILAEHRGYTGDGKGASEWHDARSLCGKLKAAPTGPWV